MKHQAVILDFHRKSVTYVGLAEAKKSIAKVRPVSVSAEPVAPRSTRDKG